MYVYLVGYPRKTEVVELLKAIASFVRASFVPAVTKCLVVVLQDSAGVSDGRVREYVAELYCRLWDAACMEKKPTLDMRVLAPLSGNAGMAGWDQAVLWPELECVFSPREDIDMGAINKVRASPSDASAHALPLNNSVLLSCWLGGATADARRQGPVVACQACELKACSRGRVLP